MIVHAFEVQARDEDAYESPVDVTLGGVVVWTSEYRYYSSIQERDEVVIARFAGLLHSALNGNR